MVWFVNHIGEMVMRPGCHFVLAIFAELGIVAVYISDRTRVAKGKCIRTDTDDGMLFMELSYPFGAEAAVGEVHEGEIGYA